MAELPPRGKLQATVQYRQEGGTELLAQLQDMFEKQCNAPGAKENEQRARELRTSERRTDIAKVRESQERKGKSVLYDESPFQEDLLVTTQTNEDRMANMEEPDDEFLECETAPELEEAADVPNDDGEALQTQEVEQSQFLSLNLEDDEGEDQGKENDEPRSARKRTLRSGKVFGGTPMKSGTNALSQGRIDLSAVPQVEEELPLKRKSRRLSKDSPNQLDTRVTTKSDKIRIRSTVSGLAAEKESEVLLVDKTTNKDAPKQADEEPEEDDNVKDKDFNVNDETVVTDDSGDHQQVHDAKNGKAGASKEVNFAKDYEEEDVEEDNYYEDILAPEPMPSNEANHEKLVRILKNHQRSVVRRSLQGNTKPLHEIESPVAPKLKESSPYTVNMSHISRLEGLLEKNQLLKEKAALDRDTQGHTGACLEAIDLQQDVEGAGNQSAGGHQNEDSFEDAVEVFSPVQVQILQNSSQLLRDVICRQRDEGARVSTLGEIRPGYVPDSQEITPRWKRKVASEHATPVGQSSPLLPSQMYSQSPPPGTKRTRRAINLDQADKPETLEALLQFSAGDKRVKLQVASQRKSGPVSNETLKGFLKGLTLNDGPDSEAHSLPSLVWTLRVASYIADGLDTETDPSIMAERPMAAKFLLRNASE